MSRRSLKRGLRTGYTTGTCAAAAAKAATLALCVGKPVPRISIRLPVGRTVCLKTQDWCLGTQEAFCCVIKDAGDDPDVTHGARICARVSWMDVPGIRLEGGEGVGRVTLPGLGLPVGSWAINPVPREMIQTAVEEALGDRPVQRGVRVIIEVPEGRQLAQKTLNPRLGIVDGISILGTTGIVYPYSTAAWRASVEQAVEVAVSVCGQVVLSTGRRTHQVARSLFPDLLEVAFVEMGIFTGTALKAAMLARARRVGLVAMIGKMSKWAKGIFQTHAAGHQVDLAFLCRLCEQQGAPKGLIQAMQQARTARRVQECCQEWRWEGLFHQLPQRAAEVCSRYAGRWGGPVEISCFLIDVVHLKVLGQGRAFVAGPPPGSEGRTFQPLMLRLAQRRKHGRER